MKTKQPTEETDTERGVSPVIGVILMVAITVILAAVIAAFVLDIGPGEPEPNAVVEYDWVDDESNGELLEVELISTDNADGVIVSDDGDEVEDGTVLTTTGEVDEFDVGGDDITIQAIRADNTDDVSNLDDTDANAIVENVEEP